MKEEEGSTAEVPLIEDTAMVDAGSSAATLPNGNAHMGDVLDASSAPAEAVTPPRAAPAVKPEAEEEEQKPGMQLAEYNPAVKVLLCCMWLPAHLMLICHHACLAAMSIWSHTHAFSIPSAEVWLVVFANLYCLVPDAPVPATVSDPSTHHTEEQYIAQELYRTIGASMPCPIKSEICKSFHVQAEPMEVDHGAAFDTTALNGTTSPADGTSISPYGTRRSVSETLPQGPFLMSKSVQCATCLREAHIWECIDLKPARPLCMLRSGDIVPGDLYAAVAGQKLSNDVPCRRKEQRVAEAAAKAAAAAARAKEAAAAAAAAIAEAVAVSVAAPDAQAGSPAAKPEQDPVRLKPKANQRQRPTAQPPAKQPGMLSLNSIP